MQPKTKEPLPAGSTVITAIEEAFFYPSDLVNTKTSIPLRVGEER